MYKVLIVDDERIIRDGLSVMIDWEDFELSLIGTAENGIDAFEIINKQLPDIVITDIKMPGMNGLDLISKVNEVYPKIKFVVLSGYGEFDFANKAMKYGVKHYILKPCDENDIIEVLEKIITEIKHAEKKERILNEMQYSLIKVLPQVKEQFLRDFILKKIYSKNDCKEFMKLFDIVDDKFRFLVFKTQGDSDLFEKLALKNIAEELIGNEKVSLSTILNENILLLIYSLTFSELSKRIEKVKRAFLDYYNFDIYVAVTEEHSFYQIPLMYDEAIECLKYSFYLGEGGIITKKDIDFTGKEKNNTWNYDYDMIGDLIKTGNIDDMRNQIENFFIELEMQKLEINITRTYCMDLFLSIVRQCNQDEMNELLKEIIKIQDMNTLNHIYEFIKPIAFKIAEKNYLKTTQSYSKVIEEVINCINNNLSNPELSLKWIANEILYMNVDYLGKLFSKETNEKFSQYVMRVRMEKAKDLLDSQNEYKIFEVTEQVGFADNTQYFSQVFKKFTGNTPSEYKKYK